MHLPTIYLSVRSVKAYFLVMAHDVGMERPDLGAMVGALERTLIALELPVLHAHDLSMWAYVVLTALATGPMRTQAALAKAIGADKTRIIGVLDDLQERELIQRRPDPADRRVHLLALTPAGERIRATAQAAIRTREEELLTRLPAADRRAFVRGLQALSGL
jgi:DNA-binding MarR family transcriptional regulator